MNSCTDCEFWKGETGAEPPATGECGLLGLDRRSEKAFLVGSKNAVLMTRADFRCTEHKLSSNRSGIDSGMGK